MNRNGDYEAFNYLFQEVKDPIIIVSKENNILRDNPASEKLLEVNEQNNEKTLSMDKPSQTQWENFLIKVEREGYAVCTINLFIKGQGWTETKAIGYFIREFKYFFVRFDLPTIITPATNVSVDSESKFTHVFNCSNSGLILTNLHGEIIDVNELFEELVQIKRADVVGKTIEFIFDLFPDQEFEIIAFYRNLMKNNTSEITLKKKMDNGNERYLHFFSSYQKESDLHLTVIRDETEKNMMKQQIEHQKALNVLGQIAASIAHEIRNPMTSLKGFTELLKYNASDEGLRYLSVIDSELERMESILSEFLLMSKPSTRKLEEVSMSSLVQQIVDLMYPTAIMKNVRIQYHKDEPVYDSIVGDAHQLKQVVINLIKNSIEVMPDGGNINISLTANGDHKLSLKVQDEGAGMSEYQLKQMFMPFFTTKPNGTGLGLPFVLKTVEDHGGEVQVLSDVGRGTTFNLLFPVQPEVAPAQRVPNSHFCIVPPSQDTGCAFPS